MRGRRFGSFVITSSSPFAGTGAKSAYIAGYLRTLRTYRAAGVILISAGITPEPRQLLGPNVPIISVAISDKSGSPSVAIDDEQAAYDATRHLLRLGHRRIGLLTGDPASVYVAQPRQRGYLRAMTEAKCTPVTATGTFFYESGASGVDELLQQDPGLTAIFAVSDEMGAAVVNELQRRGLRVPEDVSVLGFDNTSTSRRVEPDTALFPRSRLDRCRRQGNLRGRLPDHVERPESAAERVDAGLAGREGGGGGLAARLARKGDRRRHPVSPSASFYAPAVVLSPRGAGPKPPSEALRSCPRRRRRQQRECRLW
jgi:hypothetical protein